MLSLPGGEVELVEEGMYQCNSKDEWTKISKLVGVFYKLYTVPARPVLTEDMCKEQGGGLATVYNTRINNVMAGLYLLFFII